MEGWIKLHRKLVDWEWYTDSKMVHLLFHLVAKANHKDGKWQGIEVNRGQLITGRDVLKSQTGISTQSIRTCLDRLKSTNEITIKSTNKYSVITIVNYDSYQLNENTNQQLTNKQPTTNQQLTTNKNVKNVKNEKKPSKILIEDKHREFALKFYNQLKSNSVTCKTVAVSKNEIDHIRKLETVDKIKWEDIIGGANYYFRNLGVKFLPEIQSTRSFRDKFDKLVAHKERK